MRGQLVAAVVAVAAFVGLPGVAGAQIIDEHQRLARLSARAESAEQHAHVADQYLQHARRLDAAATRHTRNARRLEQRRFPNEQKGAAMLQPDYAERRKALEARQQAQQARQIAERHTRAVQDIRNAPE